LISIFFFKFFFTITRQYLPTNHIESLRVTNGQSGESSVAK
jgi:hypothetical protein